MANLGTAYVQIVPAATGISGKITQTLAPESSAAGIAAGKGIAANLSATLSKTGGVMMKAGGIATALSLPIVAGIKSSMEAYNVQAAAETKLTEIYKTRMGATDEAAKKTMELASALQKQGVVGDEVTLSGAQQLATFAKMPGTVDKLLPAMDNLLVQQKGVNATQQDATSIANMMGKVMMGQTGALKRAGVTFDENQEKIMKYGTEEEKAATLAEVITQNVGNMNATFAQTDAGKIQQMKNSMGDLAEKVGGILAPALSNLATMIATNIVPKVETFLNFLSSNPVFGQIAVGIAGVLAVGGPLLIVIGSIVSAIGAISGAMAGLTAAAVAPVAAVVALVAAFALIYAKSETLRTAISNAGTAIMTALQPVIQTVIAKVQELMPIISQLANIFGTVLAGAIQLVTPIITTLIGVLATYMGPAFDAVIGKISIFVSALQTIGTAIAPAFAKAQSIVGKVCKFISQNLNFSSVAAKVKSVFNTIRTAIATPIQKAQTIVNKVVTAVAKFLNFSGLANKVKTTFNSIRDRITKPIEKARDTVRKIVDKIKGFFPLKVGKILSGIKVPHINVDGGSPPFGIGGKGSKPHISVSWNKKAMMNPYLFSDATLFGAGEAGDEVLYGRQALMSDITDALSNAKTDEAKNVNVTNYITVDGAKDPEEWVEGFVRSLELRIRTA